MANTVYELYRSAPVVWVEDDLTREVLTILWGSCRLHVAVAGSKAGVGALVKGAPPSLEGRVFGVVDLDFTKPNRDVWRTTRELRFDVHECENLLLDADCLAAVAQKNGAAISPADIEAFLRARAAAMVPWMACRATLRVIGEDLKFPPDPTPTDVPDLAAAVRLVRAAPAWRDSPGVWARWTAVGVLEKQLASWETLYREAVVGDDWRALFSGKELFRAVRGETGFRLDATPKRLKPSPAERDLDLARTLAHTMVARGRVPASVTAMRDALLAR
jgi:hypothetical protein